jgi:hypothetical protein
MFCTLQYVSAIYGHHQVNNFTSHCTFYDIFPTYTGQCKLFNLCRICVVGTCNK